MATRESGIKADRWAADEKGTGNGSTGEKKRPRWLKNSTFVWIVTETVTDESEKISICRLLMAATVGGLIDDDGSRMVKVRLLSTTNEAKQR